jgi:predicted RNA methylase
MSATNRGAVRVPDDFYGTPSWTVDAILPHLPLAGTIVDLGCGEGQILERVAAIAPPRASLYGVEIDPVRAGVCRMRVPRARIHVLDFLAMPPMPADLFVFNPPYDVKERPGTTAFAFVRKAHEAAAGRGTVAALLRLNWLEGAASEEPARLAFLRAHPPDIFITPKRPSFGLNKDGKRATDATAYGWMVWGPGRVGVVRWLDVEAAR